MANVIDGRAFKFFQSGYPLAPVSERILGVEGGGTKTSWVLVEPEADSFRIIEQGKLPPSNVRLTTPERRSAIFRQMPQAADRVGVFLAGCATAEDRIGLTEW